mgnify:CR=1 FL=1
MRIKDITFWRGVESLRCGSRSRVEAGTWACPTPRMEENSTQVANAQGRKEKTGMSVQHPQVRVPLSVRSFSDGEMGGECQASVGWGRLMVNVLPWPRPGLVTVTVPPWASMLALTMASPSPAPPRSRPRAWSVR